MLTMYPRVFILVIVLMVRGGWTLTQNEWIQAILKSYAQWTKAVNARNIPDLLSLYSKECLELQPGLTSQNYQGLQKIILSALESGGYPKSFYMGYVELLDSTDDMALAEHAYFKEEADGSTSTGKGVRWFKIENGEVKIKLSIYNYND